MCSDETVKKIGVLENKEHRTRHSVWKCYECSGVGVTMEGATTILKEKHDLFNDPVEPWILEKVAAAGK